MVIALGMMISGAANAFTAVTSGNWSSAATWGGVAPGPNVSNADIIIPAGISVTLDADVAFSGILNQFQVTGTLTSASMNKLTINVGVLSGSGVISIRKVVFANLATATFAGTMNVNELVNSSSSLAFVAVANVSDSLMLDNGSLNINTNGNLTLMGNSTVKVGDGTIGVNGGVFGTGNSYNVVYVGSSKTSGVELNSATVQNLYVNLNSNTENLTLSNTFTVNGNLSMPKGRINLNGRKLTLKGDFNAGAGASFISTATSELVIEGNGALTSGLMFNSGSTSINNLTVDRSGTVKLMSALDIYGDLKLLNGSLSLESGSTLTMNSGADIMIGAGGVISNSGSFVGTNSYNVEYMGAVSRTVGIEASGSGLNNVTVNYSSVNLGVALSNSLAVNGKLDMMNGHLVMNGQNLTLNGTFGQNANATFVGHANSELTLNMTAAATTSLYFDNTSGPNNTLSKLTLNAGGNSDVMLGSQLTIRNELKFIKGKIMLDNGDLIIEPTATITGYDNLHYVVTSSTSGSGRLMMNVAAGGSYVIFPVGTSNNYSPAHIQQTSAATSGYIMVRTINQVYTGGYAGWDNAMSSPVVGRTWMIDAATGVTTNMNMKLGWVAAAELNGFNRNTAMIRHYTNGSWDTDVIAAASAGANGTFELGRTGITSLSPFAVADASAPVGVKNNTRSSLGFEVYPNPAKDVLILETSATMQGYKYEVVDVTGKIVKTGTTSQTSSMVDVASLKAGYYFIKVINLDDNVSGVKRFVKD